MGNHPSRRVNSVEFFFLLFLDLGVFYKMSKNSDAWKVNFYLTKLVICRSRVFFFNRQIFRH